MKIRKIAAMAASLGIVASVGAIAPATSAGAAYTVDISDENRTTTIDKYLIMSKDSYVPDATFQFTVEAPAAADIPANNDPDKVPVFAGSAANLPVFTEGNATMTGSNTAGEVKFSHTEQAILESEVSSGAHPAFSTTGEGKDDDEQYVKKVLSLDFTNVNTFTEPGIYRYYIKESGSAPGIDNDSEEYRTLDVYVVDASPDDSHLKLDIGGYVLYKGKVTAAPDKGEAVDETLKSDGYNNKRTAHTLQFGKEVEGNQGSKDKYFKVTLTITGANGSVLEVDASKFDLAPSKTGATSYDADVMAAANTFDDLTENGFDGRQLVVDSDTYTKDFYLRDSQYVTIYGIPDGAGYTLTEVPEGYTPSAAVTGDTKTGDTDEEEGSDIEAGNDGASIADSCLKSDAKVVFTNTRQGNIPTGVLMTVAGSAGIALVGIAGITAGAIYLRKKKSEDEE